MSHQNPDGFDQLDDELRGLFTRAASHIDPPRDLAESVQQRLTQGGWSTHAGTAQRSPAIAATLSVFVVVALLVGVFYAFGRGGLRPGGSGGTGGSPGTGSAPAALSVSSVDLAVSPTSIAGAVCGSSATFTYTATFHVPAHSAGGVIQYAYTLNNGRSQTAGSVQVPAGATSATATFTSAGALPADHTWPGVAMVMVTSPSHVTSPGVTPSGACVTPSVFRVQSVAMSVSPSSVAGDACGSSLTVTYTATFHLAANGPGGTIHFTYTTTNGRGSTPASVVVAPGQTSASYSFTWSGALPADHTAPGQGGVQVSSPNALTSQMVAPTGACR